MIQALLFDRDGVIADSEPLWNDIDAALLKPYGVTHEPEADKHAVMGVSFPIALAYYRDKYQLRTEIEELIVRRTQIAGEYYAERMPVFPDAPQVLAEIRASKLKIGLATSSIAAFVLPFLERHNLTNAFDAITTGAEVTRGKPHPDIYLLAAQKAATPPASCLVIEDSLAGLQAGRDAGCLTVGLPDARFVKRENYEGRADYLLNGLGELPELVRQLLKV